MALSASWPRAPLRYTRRFCSDCGSRVTISFEKSEIESPMVGVYTAALDEVREALQNALDRI